MEALPEDILLKWEGTLSRSEKDRYLNFKSSRRKYSFLYGRILARHMLNEHFELKSSGWQISAEGQNFVLNSPDIISINISHSKDYVACGLSSLDIGVDIEQLNPERSFMRIAENYFLMSEYEAIKAMSNDKRIYAFYLSWVIKEAYAKRHGKSVFDGLSRVKLAIEDNDTHQGLPSVALPNCFGGGYYSNCDDYVVAISLKEDITLCGHILKLNGGDLVYDRKLDVQKIG